MSEVRRVDRLAGGAPVPKQTPVTATPPEKPKTVGRNDPCPCGSGKKYKKCCGAPGGASDADD
jgi:uncharacterized protein